LANETLDPSFALTVEIRVTLGLQFCEDKRGWIDGRPSQSTVSEKIWRSLPYRITDFTDPRTASTPNLRPKFDFNAQLYVAPPDEKRGGPEKPCWEIGDPEGLIAPRGVLFARYYLQLLSRRIASGLRSKSQQK
jgi:hypothetical protein